MKNCELCGEPMPAGEEMFKFHGYSGDCPKPPMKKYSDGTIAIGQAPLPDLSPAQQSKQEKTYWLVLDEHGQLMHAAGWPEACHEHINDAINEYNIEGAEKWVVRQVRLV